MFEREKQEILDAARAFDRYGLIALSGGNVSVRMPSGEVIVTPSGMIYDTMYPSDMLVVGLDGKIIEGTRKVSVGTEALLYIYKICLTSVPLFIHINHMQQGLAW